MQVYVKGKATWQGLRANILYSGSLTVDEDRLAGMYQYERVLISNVNNGQRFETYLIRESVAQGDMFKRTARRGVVGDKIIILAPALRMKFRKLRTKLCYRMTISR
ncbi:aspartate 1-decarboxylase [Candidatus Magnetomonas plexicatena]|nr:aspartate 1-decarboxylase [Nitrospirales bacterium LBB_01]